MGILRKLQEKSQCPILSSKQNVPEFIINRFRRERRAAMRNAKLRLSNVKLAEIAATMRNKSKQIKH